MTSSPFDPNRLNYFFPPAFKINLTPDQKPFLKVYVSKYEEPLVYIELMKLSTHEFAKLWELNAGRRTEEKLR